MVTVGPIGVRVHFRDPERKLGNLHVRALCPPQRGGRAGAQDPPTHRQQGSLAVPVSGSGSLSINSVRSIAAVLQDPD
jgi:hypothetical protein